MKKILAQILLTFCIVSLFTAKAFSHCEIPCGIYDDEMRIEMIIEHIGTIEKSMNQIMHLQKEGLQHSNQLIRWIMNKEDHANEIQEIVSQYFMTQRIKPDTKDYGKKLGLLHEMLIYAMKCKQTTDLGHVGKMKDLVTEFKGLYFQEK
jgi:nickel superoxide dismutase